VVSHAINILVLRFNNPKLKSRRKELRNNSTEAEKLIWSKLKSSQLGCKFRRQHSIGPYILDFYCPSKQLAIELDGGQHNEAKSMNYDSNRTEYLNSLNITVLRFWNSQILTDISTVLEAIYNHLC